MKNLYKTVIQGLLILLIIIAVVFGGSHDDGHPEHNNIVKIVKCKKDKGKKDDENGTKE